MTRSRISEAGKERGRNRKSRAGETSPTGNYVRSRSVQVSRVVHVNQPEEAPSGEFAVQSESKAVTLPPLKFLQKKRIAGELI